MKYEKYIDLLLKWNKTHSVTNYNKNELREQIKETIKPIQYLHKNIKIAIDIGTGAGIPGLILAIAMPETKWYLIEPLQKRYSFLNYAKLILKLDNVIVIPKRIEQIEPFKVDLITSRAVKNTHFLIDLSCEFIDKNTQMLLYKSEKAEEEIKNINAEKKIIKDKINYIILKDIKC
ncbi:MAG: 16S rRNA (guanine(527)-N(7))-methyltransferase RsmG [Nautilia sp.]|nr:MAG: 16S rRNA (guanine(527)-N(7))-methyltransferase RsmG [Nautilia sp.]